MEDNLYNPQFSKGFSGYKPEEVDHYVDQLLSTIRSLKEENETLEEKIGVLAESIQKYREDEDSLREALLGAQKMGDSIIKNANNKAELTMREASVKASHIVQEAHQKVEQEKSELIRVQQEVAAFKASLIDMYRGHIESITKMPSFETVPKEEAEPAEKPVEGTAEEEVVTVPEEPAEVLEEEETVKEEFLPKEQTEADEPETEETAELEKNDAVEVIPFTPVPEAGADIFEEFEKKKSEILNFDVGEEPVKRGKFSGLKFGSQFSLMDDDE